MLVYNITADAQAQPRSFWLVRKRITDLMKLLKNAFVIGRRDADPGIADSNRRSLANDCGVQFDLAVCRKFYRITKQVRQHL